MLGNLANCLVAQKRFREALQCNLEILNPSRTVQLPDKFLMNIRAATAGVYLDLNQPEKALPFLESALEQVNQKPDLEFYASDVYRFASAYHYRTGDVEKGRLYTDKMKDVLERTFSKRNAESIAEMEVKYKAAEKERKILDQQLVIEQNNLALARQRNQNILLAGALIVLILLAGSGYLYLSGRQRLREQKLLVAEKQNRLQAVVQATEEERQRIARDLHDGVGQQLSGTILQLESLAHQANGNANEKLASIADYLRKTSGEVRRLSHQMMPRALTEAGLVPAISDLLNRTFNDSGIQCTFHHHLISPRFNPQTELALFRITQELINNIVRHAKATQASVNLLQIKDIIRLTVEDNGIGFKPDDVKAGHGLLNIRTRAEGVNGTVLFEQNGQAGTLITVTVPANPVVEAI